MKTLYFVATLVIFSVCSCKQDCPDPLMSHIYQKVLDSSAQSGFLMEHIPATPMPDYSEIVVGMWTHGTAYYYKHRFILKLDLSSIPQAAQVDSAFIEFNPVNNFQSPNVGGGQYNNYGDNAMFMEQVTQSWDKSTVCWNNAPATSSTNYISVANVGTNNGGSGKISIISFVKDWVAQPSTNYGILMKLQDETTNSYRRVLYGSNNHYTITRRPVITVYYKSRGWS